MSIDLTPGQNCVVPESELALRIQSGKAADFSSFRLYQDGKTRKDEDFVFYGQTNNDDGTISLSGSATSAVFTVLLPRLAANVDKVAFAVTSDAPRISDLGSLEMELATASATIARCTVDMGVREEAALILGELYRRNGQWKFRFIAQGFRGGLKPLAEFYGVEIAADETSQEEATPAPKVNLSKVTLTKQKPKIDLSKHETKGGVFGVNLNWNQGTQHQSFFQKLRGRKSGIDLDLGAYVRLKDGNQTIIQALGERFGALQRTPYVQLLGDDRTGANAEGEWIHINGDKWNLIDEIVIFTFIYEGVANWQQTDGVATIHIPGQPEIETRLSEGNNALPMCAIARLTNTNGNISIERINRYFRGHKEMDEAFGWGFSWVSGSK